MRWAELMRRPSALAPVVMCVAALATVLVAVVTGHATPQPDEGAAAHVWQLLMGGQLPLVAFFAVRWLPRWPKPAGLVLAFQAAAGLAALAPVYFLHL